MIYFTLFTLTQTAEFYEPSEKKLHNVVQVVVIHTFVYVNHVYETGKNYFCSPFNFLCSLNVFTFSSLTLLARITLH